MRLSPCARRRAATADESTPPDMATAMVSGWGMLPLFSQRDGGNGVAGGECWTLEAGLQRGELTFPVRDPAAAAPSGSGSNL